MPQFSKLDALIKKYQVEHPSTEYEAAKKVVLATPEGAAAQREDQKPK